MKFRESFKVRGMRLVKSSKNAVERQPSRLANWNSEVLMVTKTAAREAKVSAFGKQSVNVVALGHQVVESSTQGQPQSASLRGTFESRGIGR